MIWKPALFLLLVAIGFNLIMEGNSKAVVAAEGRHDGFGGGHWNGVGQESAAGWGWKGEGGWGRHNRTRGPHRHRRTTSTSTAEPPTTSG